MQVTVLSAAKTVVKVGDVMVPATMELMFYQRKQPFNKYCKDRCLLRVGWSAYKTKYRILRTRIPGDWCSLSLERFPWGREIGLRSKRWWGSGKVGRESHVFSTCAKASGACSLLSRTFWLRGAPSLTTLVNSELFVLAAQEGLLLKWFIWLLSKYALFIHLFIYLTNICRTPREIPSIGASMLYMRFYNRLSLRYIFKA